MRGASQRSLIIRWIRLISWKNKKGQGVDELGEIGINELNEWNELRVGDWSVENIRWIRLISWEGVYQRIEQI